MMNEKRASIFNSARRVVVKIGSNVLTEDHGLNLSAIRSISRQVCHLIDGGIEIILVSSGAMASGIRKVGLDKRPDEIPKRQAIAAVGQAGLIMEYEKAFARYHKKVAQILLTGPIINENDTVMIEEIQFGDNDNLAAMITLLMDADILVNLTDIDGLYTKDPRTNSDADFIPLVSNIGEDIKKIASDIPGALGTGGMLSKTNAAKKVTAAGIPMVIANGGKPDVLKKLFSGKDVGTFFTPKNKKLKSRKCWIAFTLKPKGVIRIDDGAAAAILSRGKSLLPSGIVGVEGEFSVGAPVEFRKTDGEALGTGLVNYNSTDIRKIMGLKSSQIKNRLGHKPYDDVIHRDNLAVTAECHL
ncbi:MAG: glutamate 5-kinase [Desulfobacterales bacterium]